MICNFTPYWWLSVYASSILSYLRVTETAKQPCVEGFWNDRLPGWVTQFHCSLLESWLVGHSFSARSVGPRWNVTWILARNWSPKYQFSRWYHAFPPPVIRYSYFGEALKCNHCLRVKPAFEGPVSPEEINLHVSKEILLIWLDQFGQRQWGLVDSGASLSPFITHLRLTVCSWVNYLICLSLGFFLLKWL